MKKIRTLLMWLWMLTKRLYKKPAFLMLLLAIPLIVLGYGISAREDSGMMTIVLVCEDPADALSWSLANDLQESGNVIRFMDADTPDKGREMVSNGVADAAWIISKDIGQQIHDYVSGSYTGRGFVTVIVREETVSLMLANEKLSAKLFVECARSYFVQYFRENASRLDSVTDDQIRSYFDSVTFEEGLFSFSYVDTALSSENSMNYLLIPVRGILSVLILVCGMATAMFYISDENAGLFSWVEQKNKPHIELGYQLISAFNMAAVVLVALGFAGLSVRLGRELISMFLYGCCCCVFCQLLRLWCGRMHVIATVLPVLTVLMLAICPVFISLPALRHIQLLFPPTFYIHSVYNPRYLLYMLIYILIVKLIYVVSSKILHRV